MGRWPWISVVATQVWKGYTVAFYKVVPRNSTVVCMQSFGIACNLTENQTQVPPNTVLPICEVKLIFSPLPCCPTFSGRKWQQQFIYVCMYVCNGFLLGNGLQLPQLVSNSDGPVLNSCCAHSCYLLSEVNHRTKERIILKTIITPERSSFVNGRSFIQL
jgi:hypothetical protein